jgi:hypothetical protein
MKPLSQKGYLRWWEQVGSGFFSNPDAHALFRKRPGQKGRFYNRKETEGKKIHSVHQLVRNDTFFHKHSIALTPY